VNDFKKVFEEDKIDCLLAPVVSDDPITLAEYERSDDIFSEDDIFTVGVNLAGAYSRICERFYLFLILF
jgi:Asp-tRNA(Asn)/Glu-tRNA(Gln) amidotransferase A subunit family amidase